MTNPATDSMASSACSACSACSPCARGAVHHFALPGMGFRAAHGLLGIFIKIMWRFQGVTPWDAFSPARNFFETSVRPCDLQKRMPHKARPRTDRDSALGAPCQLQPSRNDLPPRDLCTVRVPPPSPAGCPPRPDLPRPSSAPSASPGAPRRHRHDETGASAARWSNPTDAPSRSFESDLYR